MEKIKVYTRDNYEIVLLGRDFQKMLRLVKAIPQATFVGKVEEYGEVHTYNHWEVPYTARDVQMGYGPFAEIVKVTAWQLESQHKESPISDTELDELIAIRPSGL